MHWPRLIPALLVAACAAPAFAGAWLQPKGQGLFIANATYFTSSAYFQQDGTRTPQPTFSKQELQPYAEYGLTDRWTVGGSLYAQRDAQSGRDNWGIADPELFARRILWQNDREIISIQPLVKLPSLFLDTASPRGGSRSIDGELSLLYGRNITVLGMSGYTDLRAGYRARTHGLNGQWRADAAVGLNVTDHWLLIPAFRSVIAQKYQDAATFSENGEQDYDLTKLELTAAYHLDERRWLQATVFDHLAGAYTGTGSGISLGFAERF